MRRVYYMLGLIVAGEAIFALPFHVTRFFRPTVLEVFELSATQLGTAQGLYGVFAMVAYFLGGPLADRYSARSLLAISLLATALGGIYMASFPSYRGALVLWSFFGFSTILLFWAALIRATREWGGLAQQGRAYGLLEGGRGLLAAVLATLGVALFSLSFPQGYELASALERREVLRLIILGYTVVTILAAVFVWFALQLPSSTPVNTSNAKRDTQVVSVIERIRSVMRLPTVWLHALIILCAYVGYKGFDNYSLFAVQAYGVSQEEAARLVAYGSWVRPAAAVAAGLLADRLRPTKVLMLVFSMLLVSYLVFALNTPTATTAWVLLSNTLLTCVAIFGLRGLYFALFEETKVNMAVTGTAVGLVSVIGYTPDIFVTLVAGLLIDRTPGLAGHQHFFWFLAVFAFVGLLASAALSGLSRRARN